MRIFSSKKRTALPDCSFLITCCYFCVTTAPFRDNHFFSNFFWFFCQISSYIDTWYCFSIQSISRKSPLQHILQQTYLKINQSNSSLNLTRLLSMNLEFISFYIHPFLFSTYDIYHVYKSNKTCKKTRNVQNQRGFRIKNVQNDKKNPYNL